MLCFLGIGVAGAACTWRLLSMHSTSGLGAGTGPSASPAGPGRSPAAALGAGWGGGRGRRGAGDPRACPCPASQSSRARAPWSRRDEKSKKTTNSRAPSPGAVLVTPGLGGRYLGPGTLPGNPEEVGPGRRSGADISLSAPRPRCPTTSILGFFLMPKGLGNFLHITPHTSWDPRRQVLLKTGTWGGVEPQEELNPETGRDTRQSA